MEICKESRLARDMSRKCAKREAVEIVKRAEWPLNGQQNE